MDNSSSKPAAASSISTETAGSAPSVGESSPPLGFAGEISPAEAWQRVQADQATLVDVRTAEELHWVGSIPGMLHVEWSGGRPQVRNPHFIEQLEALVPKDRQVLFLCRSGGRSASAAKAATKAGYKSAWNILEGFEGPADAQKQRGRIGGWRAAGLPWQQS